jgi:hypothetical protein
MSLCSILDISEMSKTMAALMRGTGVKTNQKVALTDNTVKNNECDVAYVLKESRRRSRCVIHKAWRFPLLCPRPRHRRVVYQRRVSD